MFSNQMSLLIPISSVSPQHESHLPIAAHKDPGEVTSKYYSIPDPALSLKGPKTLLSQTCLLSQ